LFLMIDKLLMLNYYGIYSRGEFGAFLDRLAEQGFFSLVLPFLLIFSIVYGLLSQIKMFNDNKGVNAIIALAVGFLAIQMPIVPLFFSEIFPRLAIGLSIILSLLILMGLFLDPKNKGVAWTLVGISGIVAIYVIFSAQSAINFSWFGGFGGWSNQWESFAIVLILIGGIALAMATGGKKKGDSSAAKDFVSLLAKGHDK
jgi:hypothetical protein